MNTHIAPDKNTLMGHKIQPTKKCLASVVKTVFVVFTLERTHSLTHMKHTTPEITSETRDRATGCVTSSVVRIFSSLLLFSLSFSV